MVKTLKRAGYGKSSRRLTQQAILLTVNMHLGLTRMLDANWASFIVGGGGWGGAEGRWHAKPRMRPDRRAACPFFVVMRAQESQAYPVQAFYPDHVRTVGKACMQQSVSRLAGLMKKQTDSVDYGVGLEFERRAQANSCVMGLLPSTAKSAVEFIKGFTASPETMLIMRLYPKGGDVLEEVLTHAWERGARKASLSALRAREPCVRGLPACMHAACVAGHAML